MIIVVMTAITNIQDSNSDDDDDGGDVDWCYHFYCSDDEATSAAVRMTQACDGVGLSKQQSSVDAAPGRYGLAQGRGPVMNSDLGCLFLCANCMQDGEFQLPGTRTDMDRVFVCRGFLSIRPSMLASVNSSTAYDML